MPKASDASAGLSLGANGTFFNLYFAVAFSAPAVAVAVAFSFVAVAAVAVALSAFVVFCC